MSKLEMLNEMFSGITNPTLPEMIANRMKNSKSKVENIYNYWLNSNKTKEDRSFCLNILTVW